MALLSSPLAGQEGVQNIVEDEHGSGADKNRPEDERAGGEDDQASGIGGSGQYFSAAKGR